MASKRFSNKHKFFGLVAGLLVVSLVAYALALSKTMDERKKYVALNEKVHDLSSLNTELQRWRSLNAELDSKLGGEFVLSGFQESLLASVGQFCQTKDLTLSDFSEPFEGQEGAYTIETIIITIQGRYKPLLELVHHMENQFKGGKVASVSFYKEKNYRKNREELFLEMYIQKVKVNKDENI